MRTVWIYEEGDMLHEFETEADARLGSSRTTPTAL